MKSLILLVNTVSAKYNINKLQYQEIIVNNLKIRIHGNKIGIKINNNNFYKFKFDNYCDNFTNLGNFQNYEISSNTVLSSYNLDKYSQGYGKSLMHSYYFGDLLEEKSKSKPIYYSAGSYSSNNICYKKNCNDKFCIKKNYHIYNNTMQEEKIVIEQKTGEYFIKYHLLLSYLCELEPINDQNTIVYSNLFLKTFQMNNDFYNKNPIKLLNDKNNFIIPLNLPLTINMIKCLKNNILYLNNNSKLKLIKIIHILLTHFDKICRYDNKIFDLIYKIVKM